MRPAAPARTFPLDPGGAAGPMARPVPGFGDLTALPRFGLKGPGTGRWLEAQGLAPPGINRWCSTPAGRLLRLGHDEIVLLAETEAKAKVGAGAETGAGPAGAAGHGSEAPAGGSATGPEALRALWLAGTGPAPRGYESFRDEGWAWFRLEGAALAGQMGACCAIDLRDGTFARDAVAQTRFLGIDAVVLRTPPGTGFDVLFDITCAHHVAGAIAAHVHRLSGRG